MANERAAERIAGVLRHVADNVDSYLPDEWLLESSTFVVRIPGRDTFPTVELDAEMPVIEVKSIAHASGTTSVQS